MANLPIDPSADKFQVVLPLLCPDPAPQVPEQTEPIGAANICFATLVVNRWFALEQKNRLIVIAEKLDRNPDFAVTADANLGHPGPIPAGCRSRRRVLEPGNVARLV